MAALATLTSKSQITIPKEVREKLGLRPKDQLLITVQGDRIIMIPIRRRPLTELFGVFHVDRPFPGMKALREQMGYELGRRIAEGEE